jgi:hypothetical protein
MLFRNIKCFFSSACVIAACLAAMQADAGKQQLSGVARAKISGAKLTGEQYKMTSNQDNTEGLYEPQNQQNECSTGVGVVNVPIGFEGDIEIVAVAEESVVTVCEK